MISFYGFVYKKTFMVNTASDLTLVHSILRVLDPLDLGLLYKERFLLP